MSVYFSIAPEGAFPSDLSRLHRDDDLSVVYAPASNFDSDAGACARTVMEAMGKPDSLDGGKSHVADSIHLLSIWLAAHQTRWLILLGTQRMDSAISGALLRAILAGGAQILLPAARDVGSPVPPGHDPQPVEWEAVPALIGAQPPPAPPPKPMALPVRLPPSDWVDFRADCRTHLPPEQFAATDRHYVRSLRATEARLKKSPPTVEETRDWLATIANTSESTNEALIRTRAAQAAYFKHGYNLRINAERLITTLIEFRERRFSVHDWRALRAYRATHRPAICALHGTGVPTRELATLTSTEVNDVLQTGTIRGLALDSEATPYLRAHLLYRQHNPDGDERYLLQNVREISKAINEGSRDLGLLIGQRYTGENRHTLNIWRYRDGFQLEEFSS